MRIAVVSPCIDRGHGTERAIAELVERLASTYRCQVHLFAQSVADLAVLPAYSSGAAGAVSGSIYWHRVGAIPGPQILRFAAWFILNRLQRSRGDFDAVISPGINCFDADVVIVHALFWRIADVAGRAARREGAFVGFFRELHRRTYYFLLTALERRVYADRRVRLAAVSRRTASLMESRFGREDVRVVANGVDGGSFSPALRLVRRESARLERGIRPSDLVLLMIGNDWATKGIHTILEAMLLLAAAPVRLLVVGGDVREPYAAAAAKLGLLDRCIWQPAGGNVLDCYAAADVYVSPSREDSFGLPVLEAMACGLPVITSVAAGVSELVKDGVDGFVLRDPGDAQALAGLLTRLYQDSSFRAAIGEAGALAAREWTWDRNAAAVWQLLSDVVSRKRSVKK
ncbi:MAG TPA: glycosyltransferase family 4 protein [Candidatus Dormibacteraeota bacterium]|nr:glycosyltransferase family 4 protein [Candidatus Dormibacteraeota bacterium]